MRHGICKLSVVPMRREPSHTSELVSELLFNDIYEILDKNEEWMRICCKYDSYEGWIRKLQHYELSEEEFNELLKKDKYIINTAVTSYRNMTISFGSKVFEKTENAIAIRKDFDNNIMVESAIKMLDVPYRWGGKSAMGIDCSAFVQLCAKVAGYKLPRDAYQQAQCGEIISSLADAKAGDLAFFKNEDDKITHVGIMLSNDKIIHASGKVRIDTLDLTGILNKETGQHTHALGFIKRIR